MGVEQDNRFNRPSVLLVAPSTRFLGGQAIQAARLLKRLSEHDRINVSFLPVDPSLPFPFNWCQKVKYLRTVVTTVAYVWTLVASIPRYDILHIFSASYFSFLLAPTPAIFIARCFGRKTILNYRSGEASDHLGHSRWIALPIIRLVDKIIVPSDYLVRVFEQFGFTADAVSNFIEPDKFIYRQRDVLRPVFFANRNLEPLYNNECLIKAFGMIQKSFPEARLKIAGDGSERKKLELLVEQLQLKGVNFLGRVSPSEMPRLYEMSDIYLNSPNIDNMPSSILEAFACGLAVVTTDAGGIPYIVRHEKNGLMVRCGDHEALASQVIRLLRDPALAASILENAKQDIKKYTWESVGEQWYALYHSLAPNGPAHQDKTHMSSRT